MKNLSVRTNSCLRESDILVPPSALIQSRKVCFIGSIEFLENVVLTVVDSFVFGIGLEGGNHRNKVFDFFEIFDDSKSDTRNGSRTDGTENLVGALGMDLKKSTYTLGAKLAYDPKAEKFVGNEGLNRVLTRKYRGDWTLA